MRGIGLISLNKFRKILNTAHVSIGLDGSITVCQTYIGSFTCCQKVIDLVYLCPTGNCLELNLYIMVCKHSVMDVLCVHIVCRIGTAVITAVIYLYCYLPCVCELTVCKFSACCLFLSGSFFLCSRGFFCCRLFCRRLSFRCCRRSRCIAAASCE